MAVLAPFAPYVVAGLSAVSAFGQLQAGRAQAKGYAQEAALAQVQARGEALKYKKQSVDVLKNIVRTNSALTARGYAGGIDPFSGSAQALSNFTVSEGAKEYFVTQDNQVIAREGGALQSSLYMQQARQSQRSGVFGAAGTLASTGLALARL